MQNELSDERLATLCSEWPQWLKDAVEEAMEASDENDWSTEQVLGYALLRSRSQSGGVRANREALIGAAEFFEELATGSNPSPLVFAQAIREVLQDV